eukprot:scaffold231056_cov22-Tisochrysis_lutea.AAC.1
MDGYMNGCMDAWRYGKECLTATDAFPCHAGCNKRWMDGWMDGCMHARRIGIKCFNCGGLLPCHAGRNTGLNGEPYHTNSCKEGPTDSPGNLVLKASLIAAPAELRRGARTWWLSLAVTTPGIMISRSLPACGAPLNFVGLRALVYVAASRPWLRKKERNHAGRGSSSFLDEGSGFAAYVLLLLFPFIPTSVKNEEENKERRTRQVFFASCYPKVFSGGTFWRIIESGPSWLTL